MPQQTVTGNRGDDQLTRRLQHLTGSDEVRLNDRDYMNLLHDRLEEEYSKQQGSREKKLREEEIRRVRRLKREGVIDDAQYQSEMAHIQSHGVGSERFGGPAVRDCNNDLVFPLLTDGSVEFHDNPDATTYRGYYEDPEEVQNQQEQNEKNSAEEKRDPESAENANNAAANDNGEGEGQKDDNAEGGADGNNKDDKKAGSLSPRYSRPQSVTVQQLNDVENVARMFELAKGMVFVEVGLNPPRRKGAKGN